MPIRIQLSDGGYLEISLKERPAVPRPVLSFFGPSDFAGMNRPEEPVSESNPRFMRPDREKIELEFIEINELLDDIEIELKDLIITPQKRLSKIKALIARYDLRHPPDAIELTELEPWGPAGPPG